MKLSCDHFTGYDCIVRICIYETWLVLPFHRSQGCGELLQKQSSKSLGFPWLIQTLAPSPKSRNAEVVHLLSLLLLPLWSVPQADTCYRIAVDEKQKPALNRTFYFRGSHCTWANLHGLYLMIYCHQGRKCFLLLTTIQTPKPLLSPSGHGNTFPTPFFVAPICARIDPLMKP